MQNLPLLLLLVAQATTLKVALLLEGDYSDFGWAYTATVGLREMEKTFQMHGSPIFYNVADTATTTPILEQLIDERYDIIFSGSQTQTDAILEFAQRYPSTKFVLSQSNVPKNLTNVGSIQWDMSQASYLGGYAMALLTQTKKIGTVNPPKTRAANAWFIGAQAADPTVEYYDVVVTTFYDPNRAVGASNLLYSHGVDYIGTTENDISVQRNNIEHGYMAFGTSGIDVSTLLGEDIAFSVLKNWTGAFDLFVRMVVDGNWKPVAYASSLRNGLLQFLPKLSYRIPADIQQKILTEAALMQNGTKDVFCGWYASYLGNLTTGCMNYAQTFAMTLLLPGITYLGIYDVPLIEIFFPSSFTVGFAVVTGVLLVATLTAIIGVVVFRKDQNIWSSTPTFCGAIMFGAMLCYISVLLRIPTPTEALCHATIWTTTLGYSIMLSLLIAKNFRIWRIFDNKFLEARMISNGHLFLLSSASWAGCILLLSIWSGIGEIGIDQTPGEDNLGQYEYRTKCVQNSSADAVWIAIIVYNGVLLVVGSFISYKIRNVEEEIFNESKVIAVCIYNLTFSLCVAIPIVLAVPDIVTKIALFCVCVLFSTTSLLGILFLPKFWSIWRDGFTVHRLCIRNNGKSTSATASPSKSRSNSAQL